MEDKGNFIWAGSCVFISTFSSEALLNMSMRLRMSNIWYTVIASVRIVFMEAYDFIYLIISLINNFKISLSWTKIAGDSFRGTALIYINSVFDREKQKFYELPIVMWDMRGSGSPKAQTGTNTLTIIVGDMNDNPHYPGHQNIFVYNYKGISFSIVSYILFCFFFLVLL